MFLRYYLRFENPEMIVKFEQAINILSERKITMGIEEFIIDRAEKQAHKKGREEGITQTELEKNLAFTRNLLSSTDFSIAKIAELVGVNEEFVAAVKTDLNK